jgi:phage gp36-like protein
LALAEGKTVATLAAALEDGAAEINGYIGQRYKLPLPVGREFATLKWLNCDIARYRLWESRLEDQEDNTVYVRYRKAIEFLKAIAAGDIALLDDDGALPEDSLTSDALAVGVARPQIFDNKTLRRMDYGF